MSTFAMPVEDALHDFRPYITNETVEGYPSSWWTGEIYVYPFLTTDSPNSYKAAVIGIIFVMTLKRTLVDKNFALSGRYDALFQVYLGRKRYPSGNKRHKY